MTIEAYINPDFTWPKKLIFFIVALAAIVIGNLLIMAWNKIAEPGKGRSAERRRKDIIQKQARIKEREGSLYPSLFNNLQLLYRVLNSKG